MYVLHVLIRRLVEKIMPPKRSIKTCENCGQNYSAYASQKICSALACRTEYERSLKERKRAISKIENMSRKSIEKKRTHDRKCQKCGSYCWPNWFFCTNCHPRVG